MPFEIFPFALHPLLIDVNIPALGMGLIVQLPQAKRTDR